MSSMFPPAPDEVPINPYEAPRVEGIALPEVLDLDPASAEAIRRIHLRHESSIKSIGNLMLFGAILWILFGGLTSVIGSVALFSRNQVDTEHRNDALLLPVGIVLLSFGIFFFIVGRGIRRFEPWARRLEIIACSFGVISIHPISMGLSIYTLYLLLSSKGKVVFSPEYREVIKLTPHVYYRTSLLVKILVTLLAVVLVLIIIGGIFTIMKT